MDGVDGTISILPPNGGPSEKNSALQTFSKDYELFMLNKHNLQRLQSTSKVKKIPCETINSRKMWATKH
jgi:phosphoglucomutase